MTFAKALHHRDNQLMRHEATLAKSGDWISLEADRPGPQEWVETGLEIDGEIIPQDEGIIGRHTNRACRSEDAPMHEDWTVTHWRYPVA